MKESSSDKERYVRVNLLRYFSIIYFLNKKLEYWKNR